MMKSDAGPDPALIFVHISKSAGSTLNRVIDWEYSPRKICSIDGRFYFWGFQQVLKWPSRWFAGLQVFRGHMPFGLHERIPQPTTYITMLRDPIDRIISEYSYRQISRTHPIAYRSMRGLSLKEYVTTLPYNNLQTKMIAGLHPPYDFYSGSCTADTLETAKKNLRERFALIGLTERFEESLALAKTLFGWKVPYVTSIRRTRARPARDAVGAALRGLIAEHNCFDLELYDFGADLFDRMLSEHKRQVQADLREIRRAGPPRGLTSVYYRFGSVARKQLSRALSDSYSACASLI